ncbi:MAG: polysaccharide biosynthesis C-terminal domain-containing protein [Fulvivirga sp.]|nr:polysaccharide biosynthesis C-terminal domain-containing protein [Fulvivirga sp.]
MSQLKRLAGDTAIYGISSILGRSINYLLIFLHTAFFLPDELGVITVLYSFVGFINVLYTFGMETTFFRFINKPENKKAYNIAATVVILISTLISALIIFKSQTVAVWLGYPDLHHFIVWLAVIVWIDGIMAIPFARIRQENKAKLFATVKVGNILVNVLLQVTFLWIIPEFIPLSWVSSWYDPTLGVGYIILANLIANALFFLWLWKPISKIRLSLDGALLKPMLKYAFPIMIMGLAGIANEMLGNILLEYLLPDTFYKNMSSTAAVGVYGQTLKLSIFMILAIQAFRYAGEPFFFSQAKEKNAPELFARVMHYFVIASLLILMLVSMNVHFIAEIFLRKPEYRVALYLVPILMLGKLFFGIYVNLNVWFKLTDKTMYGTYFSLLGAAVTVVGNILLIPYLGFTGSAITSVLCYFSMSFLCYRTGKFRYPIPYNFQKLLPYFIICTAFGFAGALYKYPDFIIDTISKLLISLIIILLIIGVEKPGLIKKT